MDLVAFITHYYIITIVNIIVQLKLYSFQVVILSAVSICCKLFNIYDLQNPIALCVDIDSFKECSCLLNLLIYLSIKHEEKVLE